MKKHSYNAWNPVIESRWWRHKLVFVIQNVVALWHCQTSAGGEFQMDEATTLKACEANSVLV